jgi:hypothetical protein
VTRSGFLEKQELYQPTRELYVRCPIFGGLGIVLLFSGLNSNQDFWQIPLSNEKPV